MKLKLQKLEVKDLTDKGSMFDAQDPQLAIHIGSKTLETER